MGQRLTLVLWFSLHDASTGVNIFKTRMTTMRFSHLNYDNLFGNIDKSIESQDKSIESQDKSIESQDKSIKSQDKSIVYITRHVMIVSM